MQKIGNFGAKALFFLLPFIGIIFTVLRFNFDLWFILNSGRYVIEHSLPYTEPFTMHEGLNFVLEQWSTDVVFWEIFSYFGAEGVLTFVIIIGFFILFLYEKICVMLSDNVVLSKVLTLLFGMVTVPIFLVTRPQILSTLIFLVEVYLLINYAKSNNRKFLLFIPILSLLTVNLHAALWPMIFILMLPFIANYLAKNFNMAEKYSGEKFDLKPIIVTVIVSFFIALINPYGYKAMMFLFTSFDPDVHGLISEIQPMAIHLNYTGFSLAYSSFFFIYLFGGVVLLAKKKMPLYLILLFSGLAFLAMLAQRNVLLFYAVGTVVFAYGLREYEPKITKLEFNFVKLLPFLSVDFFVLYKLIENDEFYNIPHIFIIYLTLLFGALILFVFFYNVKDNLNKIKGFLAVILPFFFIVHISFQNTASSNDYIGETYKDMIDELLSYEDIKNIRLFTGFNTGAYPEYRGIKCYIDARPEVFAPKNSGRDFSIIGEYISVKRGETYYRDFVKKYNFNYMLVEEGDGVLFVMLPHDDDFTLLREEKDKSGKVYARLYKVNINE